MYFVIWKVIFADGWVSAEECEALKTAMLWVSKAEIESLEKADPNCAEYNFYHPPKGISNDKAQIMIIEIIRVGTLDGDLALIEMAMVEKAAQMLGFGEEAIVSLLAYAASLARLQACQKVMHPTLSHDFQNNPSEP
ncbi:MAG: hypothetical protein QNL04_03665 [SAR324 cluster bacterium]|nr:hypothetical protein [SAR324 cluster bacterium]